MRKLITMCLVVLVGASIPKISLAATHSVGTNINISGTISMIKNGPTGPCRADYTSAGAFLSYGFNAWATVVPASPEDSVLAICSPGFIPPAPGTIIFSDRGADKGTGYFMAIDSDGTVAKRAFTSGSVFLQLGYKFENGSFADVSWMKSGQLIDNAVNAHPTGTLINKDGTILFVSPLGLLGVPSEQVFQTWGMNFANAVPANVSDRQLAQTGVLSPRGAGELVPSMSTQLQNSPQSPTVSATDEDIVIKGYIDTHPTLPVTEEMNADAAAQILAMDTNIAQLSLIQSFLHMTNRSVEMINKAPKLRASLMAFDGYMSPTEVLQTKSAILSGGQFGKITKSYRQTDTGYTLSYTNIYSKEDGQWKYDLIGTFKNENLEDLLANPAGDVVSGSGSSDISISDMTYFPDPVKINSNAFVEVVVKNSGATTINRFAVFVSINGTDLQTSYQYKKLLPGQSVRVPVSLAEFWSTGNKGVADYIVVAEVSITPGAVDKNTADNYLIKKSVFY